MDQNSKVIEMREAEQNAQETVIEAKPKFKDRVKSWAKRNKKKILIVAGAASAVGGAAAAKAYKDKKDEAAAQSEAEQAQLAEDWYQKGNAYRKQSDWQHALDCYMEAIALDPDSPAVVAKKMLEDILNFYHKDAYNP